jgi:general secretion pathway protein F
MAMIAVATILALLVPSLAGIFADANVEPPATVQALLAVRNVFANHFPLLISGMVAFAFVALVLRRMPGVRLAASRLITSTPIVGGMIIEAEASQFARVLAVQLKGGVPLVAAIGTAVGLVRSSYLKSRLAGVADAVAQGSGLALPLATAGLLPQLLIRLAGVGEETGQLERMLLHAAEVYERKVERNLDRAVALITPVLTILIGIGVGSLVLSVMDAVFSINEMVLR